MGLQLMCAWILSYTQRILKNISQPMMHANNIASVNRKHAGVSESDELMIKS